MTLVRSSRDLDVTATEEQLLKPLERDLGTVSEIFDVL
jgi:hypothetical protein